VAKIGRLARSAAGTDAAHRQLHQRSGGQVIRHQPCRHLSPPEARAQQFELDVHVGHAPGRRREHVDVIALAQGARIFHHDLHVLGNRGIEALAAAPPRMSRQRVGRRGHRDGMELRQEFAADLFVGVAEGCDGKIASPRIQRIDGAAHRAVFHADGNARIHRVHAAHGLGDHGRRKERVHRQRQAELDALLETVCPHAQGVDLRQDDLHVAEECLARGREHRLVARAVEEPNLQLLFQVGNRVTHGRLHAVQPGGAGAKAAGVGNGDEHLHLAQCEDVQHDLFH